MTIQGTKDTITMMDIARMAGVSKKTVSRVVNAPNTVKEKTRLEIQKIIKDTGFVPNPQAQALAFRRSTLIGLVNDNPSPQYTVNIQRGVLQVLRDTPYQLVLQPCDRSDPDYRAKILAFVQRQNPFGLIFVPSISEDEALMAELRERRQHFVRIASIDTEDRSKQIKTDDAEGGRLAARHLAQLGHTRIAHIHGPQIFMSAHERRKGFVEGLREYGLKLAPDMVIEGGYNFDSGVHCATNLLLSRDRPTAIFAGNDEMAMGVYTAARKAGLRVPEDLSVVGFDDTPIVSRIFPAMTSVRSPIRDVGVKAAELLLATHGKPADTQSDVPAPIALQLIIRESTANVSS